MKAKIKLLGIDDGTGIAASFARVSTPDQGEKGTSLDTQEAANVARAEALGYRVPERYRLRQVASGGDTNPARLAELYRFVANREVQCVVVYETDRLARDPIEVVKFGRHCIEHGVLLDFVTGRSFETIYDELIHFVAGAIGMEERRLIAERTMRGKLAVAVSGKMPCGNGRGMLGYNHDAVTGARTINEAEAVAVRMACGQDAGSEDREEAQRVGHPQQERLSICCPYRQVDSHERGVQGRAVFRQVPVPACKRETHRDSCPPGGMDTRPGLLADHRGPRPI